jgi:hypothetical protein
MRNIPALLAKARKCTVRQNSIYTFDVHTPSDSHHIVYVQPTNGNVLRHTCGCTYRHWQPENTCTHILAVELHLAQLEQVRLSVWYHKADALRQHRAMRVLGDLYITVRRSI